jgi:hypothetical protein
MKCKHTAIKCKIQFMLHTLDCACKSAGVHWSAQCCQVQLVARQNLMPSTQLLRTQFRISGLHRLQGCFAELWHALRLLAADVRLLVLVPAWHID